MEHLTDYVVDTIAMVRHLDDGLPRSADKVFAEAEAGRGKLYFPEIALGEMIYVLLKGRSRRQRSKAEVTFAVDEVLNSPYISISSLTASGWQRFLDLDVSELHDRMIAADALSRGLGLVTNDEDLEELEELKTVWE